jgi:hypothetical protein
MNTKHNYTAIATIAIIGMFLINGKVIAKTFTISPNYVTEKNKALDVILSMNPTGDNITIGVLSNIKQSMVMIMVIDVNGRVVKSEANDSSSSTEISKINIDVSSLPVGKYSLLVYQDGKYYNKEFIKN